MSSSLSGPRIPYRTLVTHLWHPFNTDSFSTLPSGRIPQQLYPYALICFSPVPLLSLTTFARWVATTNNLPYLTSLSWSVSLALFRFCRRFHFSPACRFCRLIATKYPMFLYPSASNFSLSAFSYSRDNIHKIARSSPTAFVAYVYRVAPVAQGIYQLPRSRSGTTDLVFILILTEYKYPPRYTPLKAVPM